MYIYEYVIYIYIYGTASKDRSSFIGMFELCSQRFCTYVSTPVSYLCRPTRFHTTGQPELFVACFFRPVSYLISTPSSLRDLMIGNIYKCLCLSLHALSSSAALLPRQCFAGRTCLMEWRVACCISKRIKTVIS